MPVIIREEITIGGKKILARVFKSESQRPLTKQARLQAEELDQFIDEKMAEVENEISKMGLLELKNRPGVLKLWFEVGKRLAFVEKTTLVSTQDRQFIWRALYDHARNLSPSLEPPTRASGPRNHFRYCCLLASKFPDYEYVEAVGDWRTWIDLFDSPTIQNDERIIDWIASKYSASNYSQPNWLRSLINAIRNEFPAMAVSTDTTVLKNDELRSRLDRMYTRVFPRLK
jgi:hypothetical protein